VAGTDNRDTVFRLKQI